MIEFERLKQLTVIPIFFGAFGCGGLSDLRGERLAPS